MLICYCDNLHANTHQVGFHSSFPVPCDPVLVEFPLHVLPYFTETEPSTVYDAGFTGYRAIPFVTQQHNAPMKTRRSRRQAGRRMSPSCTHARTDRRTGRKHKTSEVFGMDGRSIKGQHNQWLFVLAQRCVRACFRHVDSPMPMSTNCKRACFQ